MVATTGQPHARRGRDLERGVVVAANPYPDGEMVIFSGRTLVGVAGADEHGDNEADISANPGADRRVRRVE